MRRAINRLSGGVQSNILNPNPQDCFSILFSLEKTLTNESVKILPALLSICLLWWYFDNIAGVPILLGVFFVLIISPASS